MTIYKSSLLTMINSVMFSKQGKLGRYSINICKKITFTVISIEHFREKTKVTYFIPKDEDENDEVLNPINDRINN